MPADLQSTAAPPDSVSLHGAQPQLQRLQRMEIVGALAAGIAHEFNNLLLAMRGNLALALTLPGAGEAAAERLRQADGAAARASELSQRLMALARPATDQPGPLDFNQVAQEAGQLAARAWRGRIALTVQPAPEPGRVWMDSSLAAQAVLSLCLNAGESFAPRAPGGRVTITNGLVRLDAARARQSGRAEGESFLCCTVADNGPGIAPDALPRLFTPFFTTKPHGTGLGLAMTQLTVQSAGGFLEAENPPAGGAEFRIFLPLHVTPELRRDAAENNLDGGEKNF